MDAYFSIDYDVKNLIKITSIVSQEMNRESWKLFHQDETRFWIVLTNFFTRLYRKLKPKKIRY